MTEDEIKNATAEQLRVMVLEQLGWERVAIGPAGNEKPWFHRDSRTYSWDWRLPDYPCNIAAMQLHKAARKDLGPERYARYLFALGDILTDKYPGPSSCWTALLEFFDADTICRAWLLAKLQVEP